MFLANGIDLVEIARIAQSTRNPRFLRRVYGTEEQAHYYRQGERISFLAGNFAAKEAFLKAIGTGLRGVSFAEIQILRDPLGKPYLKLAGSAAQWIERYQIHSTVSITHERQHAAAVVTLWSETANSGEVLPSC